MRIIHLSDFHCESELFQWQYLFDKRLPGYTYYMLKRRHQFTVRRQKKIIRELEQKPWDYLIITGDITNLSSEEGFQRARHMLMPLLLRNEVIIIPGNHDRYTYSSARHTLFERYFGTFCPFKEKKTFLKNLEDQVLLMGLDMAVPQLPFFSKGKISAKTLLKSQALLNRHNNRQKKEMLKIALGHFPLWLPDQYKENYTHRLSRAKLVKNFLIKNNFDLYLHGHIHKSWVHQPTTPSLVSINSGGSFRRDQNAGYHEIIVNDDLTYQINKI